MSTASNPNRSNMFMYGFCSGALLLFATAFFIGIPSSYAASGLQDVEYIRQNYHERLNSQLVQQIHGFSKSVLFYKAYASYFDRADVNLPGFSKFFQSLSGERIESAQNLTKIVNERGGFVTFQNIKLRQTCMVLRRELARYPHVCFYVLDQPPTHLRRSYKQKKDKYRKYVSSYKNKMTSRARNITPTVPTAHSALEDALALERSTNNELIALMESTATFEDPAMRVKLDAYLERQVDIIFNLSNLVTRLGFYKDSDSYALGEYILDSELTY